MENVQKIFLDTNAVLNLQDDLVNQPFMISQKTLEELENIKVSSNKDSETKYKARHAIRQIDENPDKVTVIRTDLEIYNILCEFELESSPDNVIMSTAYRENKKSPLLFCSDDICCKTIGREVFGLNVKGLEDLKTTISGNDRVYKGYKLFKGNTAEINEYMSNINSDEWHENEYLLIYNIDDGSEKEMRYNRQQFVRLNLPDSHFIKGKNALQRCALDALMNPEITIVAILGGYGSGKTLLSLQMALHAIKEKGTQSKILGVREPRGEGTEVGFLPGTLEDKTDNFFLPLEQQLDGGEFEMMSLKQQGLIESTIPYYMKGTTYNHTVIVADEAEDLTESQIKLIGTRLGSDSKIFFAGDYKQSLVSKSCNNALIKMCNEFKGNSKFACVYLGEDVRSETSKLFADLFENEY
ncbi:MAG: hypothetical protein [Bacteriophage sp.]|nr:MAG: hypothetical protein [Bacteriophage sp.]